MLITARIFVCIRPNPCELGNHRVIDLTSRPSALSMVSSLDLNTSFATAWYLRMNRKVQMILVFQAQAILFF